MREGAAIGSIHVLDELGAASISPKSRSALLHNLCRPAAIAIENVRLFEAVQARTRDLTEALGSRPRRPRCLGDQ